MYIREVIEDSNQEYLEYLAELIPETITYIESNQSYTEFILE